MVIDCGKNRHKDSLRVNSYKEEMLSEQVLAFLMCTLISVGVLACLMPVILRYVIKWKRHDTATATRRLNKKKRKKVARNHHRGRHDRRGPEENDDDGLYNSAAW